MKKALQGAGVFAAALGSLGLVAGGAAFVIALIFFNVIVGAFVWPHIGNMLLAYAHKPEMFVWWHGALFSLVPYLGRWYVGLILWAVLAIVL